MQEKLGRVESAMIQIVGDEPPLSAFLIGRCVGLGPDV